MSAFDLLSQKNGLKTTKTVLGKQQSGVDAAQKANPQQPTFTMSQLDAMKKDIDKQNAAVPSDPDMKQARERTIATQQAIAKGVDVNQGVPSDETDKPSVPIVKKESPKVEQPKQMSYADMFKAIYGNGEETEEQKARREKRERTKAKIAAIGDGLRALSNMYFATKGAKVIHNPDQDLSAVQLKRKQMLDANREKNKSAWLNGYLKAQALDEEARKNKVTLAEQVRYHDQLAKNRERVGDQKDRSLDQNQQKIDLSKLKYTNDADYKKKMLEIKTMLANGQISHWGAQDAMSRLREGRLAAKANDSSGGNKTTAGYWYEYYDMMDSPEGQEKINELKRRLRIKNVTQSNVRYLMDRLKGRRSETAPAGNGGGKAKAAAKGKSSSSSSGGKKSTGVKW